MVDTLEQRIFSRADSSGGMQTQANQSALKIVEQCPVVHRPAQGDDLVD
jgi:hypothetical protein